ncbi:MAG: hypothetical protein AAGN82_30215 [Myxococcota bacterium]
MAWHPAEPDLEQARRAFATGLRALEAPFVPKVDLADAASHLAAALTSLLDLIDRRGDLAAAADRFRDHVSRAIAALARGGDAPPLSAARAHLERAHAHVVRALELGATQLAPTAMAPLRASGDQPRLHDIARPSLRPEISLPEAAPPTPPTPLPPARPTSFEALDATLAALGAQAEERLARQEDDLARPTAPPPSAAIASSEELLAEPPPPPLSEAAAIRARARELFEEVTMIGLQRTPLRGDPWRHALALEQRLGRAVDAIAALGPEAVAAVEPFARDAPVKDGMHLFGAAVVLGCISGRDTIAAIERLFHEFERVDPEVRHDLARALQLVPHPDLAWILRGWLTDPDPRHRALALRVLARRGWASPAELEAGVADHPLVAAEALLPAAMARVPIAERLADALGDDALRDAAWRAGLVADVPLVLHALRDASGEHPGATRYLALGGGADDAALVLERARATGSAADLYALGFTGSVAAIATLLDALEAIALDDDDDTALIVAAALDRITGANLFADHERDAEDIDVDVPPDPDVGEPPPRRLVHAVSDRRDLPPEPARETLWLPCTDVARWRQWWDEHGADFSVGTRYRRGRPFAPEHVRVELSDALATPAERRDLHLELLIRTGCVVPFCPDDWVVTQERALAQWKTKTEGQYPLGTWQRRAPS